MSFHKCNRNDSHLCHANNQLLNSWVRVYKARYVASCLVASHDLLLTVKNTQSQLLRMFKNKINDSHLFNPNNQLLMGFFKHRVRLNFLLPAWYPGAKNIQHIGKYWERVQWGKSIPPSIGWRWYDSFWTFEYKIRLCFTSDTLTMLLSGIDSFFSRKLLKKSEVLTIKWVVTCSHLTKFLKSWQRRLTWGQDLFCLILRVMREQIHDV